MDGGSEFPEGLSSFGDQEEIHKEAIGGRSEPVEGEGDGYLGRDKKGKEREGQSRSPRIKRIQLSISQLPVSQLQLPVLFCSFFESFLESMTNLEKRGEGEIVQSQTDVTERHDSEEHRGDERWIDGRQVMGPRETCLDIIAETLCSERAHF